MKLYLPKNDWRLVIPETGMQSIVVAPDHTGPEFRKCEVYISQDLNIWGDIGEKENMIHVNTNHKLGSRFVGMLKNGDYVDVSLVLIGVDRIPMVRPYTKDVPDNRVLVIDTIPQSGPNKYGRVVDGKNVLDFANYVRGSEPKGEIGSGIAFVAVLDVGERIVSSQYAVWENVDGFLVYRELTKLEYCLEYENPEIVEV